MYAVIEQDRTSDRDPIEFRELPSGRGFTDNAGVNHGWNVITLWSPADLAALKIYLVEEPEAPEGMEMPPSAVRSYRRENGVVMMHIPWRPIGGTPKPEELVEALPVLPEPVVKPLPPILTMDEERALGQKYLNRSITTQREKYSTLVVHQGPIYEIKRHEAAAYLANPGAGTANLPFLAASLAHQADGHSAEGIALLWKAQSEKWMIKSAELEARRIVAKKAIARAQTTDEIDEAIRKFEA